MKEKQISIIGGGLAGLTAAIHLSNYGFKIQVFEKESYPHHKVCGEYLSREILPYLESLNININTLAPASLNYLVYSSPKGKSIKTSLPLGGIGVSRYALDNFLFHKARECGVVITQETVTSVKYKNGEFIILTQEGAANTAMVVLGAFGKRSLLDKKLGRDFITKKTGWLAVKGHYKMDSFPNKQVSLHNFKGGYCGLSKTETGAVNVCYLATYKSFKKYKDPIAYNNEVLSKNKHLKRFFENSQPLFEQNLTIAQISFDKKDLVYNHILMLGDAAGLIHPLCGNGMAMAIHSAKIASESIIRNFNNSILNRQKLEQEYKKAWNKNFNSRIKTGRILQKILLNPTLAVITQWILNMFPSLLKQIIKKTHGKPV